MVGLLDALPEGHELFVYLGQTTDAKGKPYRMWIEASELDKADAADFEAVRRAAKWYGKKADTQGTIGGLYSIKCERSGERCSLWFGTKQYSGQSSHSLVPAFQAAEATVRDMEYRTKNEKRAQEPVYMRDMERTVEALKGLPRRQALDIANAISIELRRRILEAK